MSITLYVPGTQEKDLSKVIMSLQQVAAQVAGDRQALAANKTYYVRTDGSDNNDGSSNSTTGAFQTISHATSVASMIDTSAYQLTISVQAGTYVEKVTLPRMVGGIAPILAGVGSTTIINQTADVILNDGGTPWIVRDLKLTSTSGFLLTVRNGGSIFFQGIEFGATTGYHIVSFDFASITCTGNYSISGGAAAHWEGSGFIDVSNVTITITGTPAFASAFAETFRGYFRVYNNTFSGSATGVRYLASANGVIFVAGAGATYLPGNSAGSTTTGGQYT